MISVTPQGNIYLCKTPLENDYKNQLTFQNLEQQLQYFNTTIQKSFSEYTYVKKDNVVKVGCNIDEIINCNYLYYINNGFSNKYYFCFITNMEYINENCTAITFETDCFQTWQFQINYKRCFVEREHVSNDTIGLHTLNENLDVGDVIEEFEIVDDSYTSEYGYWVAMETSWLIDNNSSSGGKQFDGATLYNKNIWGNKIVLFHIIDSTDIVNIGLYIMRTNADGHITDINNLFIVPNALIKASRLEERVAYIGSEEFTFFILKATTDIESFETEINKLTSFYDYTPKNNKCFCYPYNYLLVSNNNGNQNIYRYENFYGQSKCKFLNKLAMSVGVSGKLVPLNYKRIANNEDEAIPLGKYPVCGWSSDAYINWLTQNAVNITSSITSIAINTGIGIATAGAGVGASATASEIASATKGDLIGTGINASGSIASLIGGFYSASLMPNIQGGQNTGDVTWASDKNCFSFKGMRAKTENLKIIDNYFSSYGYKVNDVKIPNITGRRNWNYVKTIDCNFDGDIPQTDLQIIKAMFNSGVTMWHNASTFLDYSQPNNII